MEKQICVIGNSHTGAIKLAWDEMAPRYPGLHLDFYGSIQKSWDTTKSFIHSGSLFWPDSKKVQSSIAKVSGKGFQIDASHYEAFILVGAGFNLLYPIESLDQFGLAGDGVPNLISRSCLERIVRDVHIDRIGPTLIRAIRSVSASPIFLMAAPFLSEACMDLPRFKYLHCVSQATWSHLSAGFKMVIREACEPTGVRFIPQVKESLACEYFTKAEFGNGAVDLKNVLQTVTEPSTRPGIFHMNRRFGELMLTEILRVHGILPTGLSTLARESCTN